MERDVVILDIDYVTYETKPVIRLFSKDGDKNIILIDDTFQPYLYVMSDDIDRCMSEIKENLEVVKQAVDYGCSNPTDTVAVEPSANLA